MSTHFDRLAYALRILPAAAIIAAAWAALGLLVWNLDRGFDLTDEAYLLYEYRHPEDSLDRMHQHSRIVRALVSAGLDNIFVYRLIKLIGFVVLTGAFSAAIVLWMRRRCGFASDFSLHPLVLFHFVLIGTLMAYCHGSQTLSYNDLMTFGLLIVGAACFSFDLSPAKVSPFAWRFAIALLIGATIALVASIKWPCAPLLTGYVVLFATFISADRSPRALAATFAGAIAGVALIVLLASDSGFGNAISYPKVWASIFYRENLEIHPPSAVIRQYVAGVVARTFELLRTPAALAVLVLPFVAIVVGALSADRPKLRPARVLLTGATLVAAALFITEASTWAPRHTQYFFRAYIADLQTFAFAGAWISACACVYWAQPAGRRHTSMVLLGAALMVASLPVVGAVGSANPLLSQFIRHMGPLFAGFAITVALLGSAVRWRPLAPLMCAAIAVLSVAQLTWLVLHFPYRLAEAGVHQTVVLHDPPHMRGLKVDARTSEFVARLRAEATRTVGSSAGTPILAMFDIPGVVYILDGVSVGATWLTAQNSHDAICRLIGKDPASSTSLRLILIDRELPAELVDCMRAAGIDLAAYQERARIRVPDRWGANGRFLRILTPKK